ncbi:MAG: methionine biosynthesis protein MetW [Rhodospirillales bacterium]|nr:methionine biosynthesis protein MetW [Rhodospirillales bacterium]MCW8970590.1 methionine biosynthesis protein MetW [Rhodospirillales bacterium]MCW9002656.1 methionine biosynthesis protein MetW [Rhodospirillales bacterium]MCW9039570.1 methionine biosynthesis protein MetW [Rhodospirillales bacterium]
MMRERNRMLTRVDLQLVAGMIDPGSRVLDVGSGDGTLLDHLVNEKKVDGRGLEISTAGVNACVSAGLSVIQGNADTDLAAYPDQAFDYVILSQTLQTMHAPREALTQLLRIGRRAIVSFPNFGHWRVRLNLLVRGRMPYNETLPHEWYDTPNIHLCTIRDFIVLCDELGITIERSIALDAAGNQRRIRTGLFMANLLGEQAVFLLRRH